MHSLDHWNVHAKIYPTSSWNSHAEYVNTASPCTIVMQQVSTAGLSCIASLQDYSVSFSRRPDIQALIGDQAEFLVHTFCIMDLASLDATMDAPPGKHHVMARKQHGGHPIPLTDQQYRDLITVQLADWLEQVCCCPTCPACPKTLRAWSHSILLTSPRLLCTSESNSSLDN